MKIEYVKCARCGKSIDKVTAFKKTENSRTYYCNVDCFEAKMAKDNTYKKQLSNSPMKPLTDYIQDVLYVEDSGWDKKDINWAVIGAMIKRLKENNPRWADPYNAILFTLKYMRDVLQMPLITKESHYNPLTLVEFYAKEAEDYFTEMFEIKKAVDDFNIQNIETNTIHVTSRPRETYKQITFD